jgi:hypothetical protein
MLKAWVFSKVDINMDKHSFYVEFVYTYKTLSLGGVKDK